MDPMNKNITEDTQRKRFDAAIVAVKLMFDDNRCQYYFLAFMVSCTYSSMYNCQLKCKFHYTVLPDAGAPRDKDIDDKGASLVDAEDTAAQEPDFDERSKSLQSNMI
jgi:hypothetical protein